MILQILAAFYYGDTYELRYINEKTHPQMYKEIGDIVFEMAMDTYGHYFSGIVVLVEVEPNTYKMIEK